MSTTPTSHSLQVSGARLHYDTIGSGPVLALIGLPMSASGFTSLASHLASDYTVVTYDPRGFGRSTVDDPDQDTVPELVADDVRRVLAAVTDQPALVFGSSGGAVTGLELVTRHPERVRTLVAHEPPVIEMLPDADTARAGVRDVYDTYRADGADAAFGKFMVLCGFEVPKPDPASSPPPAPSEPDRADGERMLAHSMLATTAYRPDVASLKAASTRIVIGGGVLSRGQLARRTGDALAAALGTPVAEFPGDHGGFMDAGSGLGGEPGGSAAFARVLRQVLTENG
jgi:pimeloyl-ACP methyl ester carboxylesterase